MGERIALCARPAPLLPLVGPPMPQVESGNPHRSQSGASSLERIFHAPSVEKVPLREDFESTFGTFESTCVSTHLVRTTGSGASPSSESIDCAAS